MDPEDRGLVPPHEVRGGTAVPLWVTAAVMSGLALIAFLPAALGAQFLNFDDNFYFGPDNPEFREGLRVLLDPSRPIANAWLPVAHVSLWFDLQLGGGNPFLPHLTSLLLHAAAAVVLVRLFLALGAGRPLANAWLLAAHVAGALFVVHPALAESVSWVSGRKDVLSGLFVFAALLQTARCSKAPAAWRLVGIGALGALAMYAKATAVVLPLLSLLVCMWVGGSRRRFAAPLVLLLVTVPIALHHQAIAIAQGTLAAGDSGERLQQVPGAYWHYFATAFWPTRLNVLYPEVDTLVAFRASAGFALGVLGSVFAGVSLLAWSRPRWRLCWFGLACFFVALLPFNTAYPASSIAAADRYLYLAVPGAALAFVAALWACAPRQGPWVAAALLAPALWLAGARAHDFASSETLWRSSLAVESENAVAHLNLVDTLRRRPIDIEVLRAHLEAAVAAARYPIHELQAYNLLLPLAMMEADYAKAAAFARAAIDAATAQMARETHARHRAVLQEYSLRFLLDSFEPLRLSGDVAAAEANFERARTLAPGHPSVIAFGVARDLAAAVRELQGTAAQGGPVRLSGDDPRGAAADATLAEALARHPNHAGLLCTQAQWDLARDRGLSALRYFRLAQAADPECLEAWLGAARFLRERENFADAEQYARQGLQRRPDPALRQELALALVGQGRLDDAIQHLEAYLRVRPDDREAAKVLANVLIGRAYARLGEPGSTSAEVLQIVQRALSLNPQEGKAHLVLGRLARQERRLDAAVAHLETAYRLLPDFDDARRLLAESLGDLGYARVLQQDDDGAGSAFRRCLDVAPEDFDTEGIRLQLTAIWRRHEERGVRRWQEGDRDGAIADFRRCLALDPDQHWAAWLLANALDKQPEPDLVELERLCRQAVEWQRKNGLDRGQQVYLLASTLVRAGRTDEARDLAREYVATPSPECKPQVLAALRRIAGD